MAGSISAPFTPPVDRTALRSNQIAIIAFLLIGFLLDQPWLVAFVCAVLALGTVSKELALFQRIYRDVLRPAGLLQPDLSNEDIAPHRFTQGMAAAVLLIAAVALFSNLAVLGWALALIVIALAAINLAFGFCVGCFIYLQIARLRG